MQTALFTPHWTLTHLPPLIPLEFMAVALRMKMSALIDACDGSVFHHCWNIGTGSRRAEWRVHQIARLHDVSARLACRTQVRGNFQIHQRRRVNQRIFQQDGARRSRQFIQGFRRV